MDVVSTHITKDLPTEVGGQRNMINKFLNDFKLNIIPYDIPFVDALKDPNSEIINVTVLFDPSEQIETDSFVQGDEILQPQNAGEQTQEARRSFVQGDEILQPQNAGEQTQEARRSFVQGDEILQPQNAGEQTQEARRSFVVSRRGTDFFHSVQHNYHKELTIDIVIGGYTVWHTTIKPNCIEWIFGGMPLLLINIQYSMVRLIIRDGDKILHTNQLDLTLYFGAIIDSSERRFIAQNPPFCRVKEGKYLHENYVRDAEEDDLLLKRNLIFYPHR